MKSFEQFIGEAATGSDLADKVFATMKREFPSARVFSVGGSMRDEMYAKHNPGARITSKDADYMVVGVPMDDLKKFLSGHGKIIDNDVGGNFSVIKFVPSGAAPGDEPVDVALPRAEKERPGEKGHRATIATGDHTLPPEEDLKRRDFTINMIAGELGGGVLDPFGGEMDIKNRRLRMIKSSDDPDDPYHHFFIDPLRMLRGVQFMARFGLTPDPDIRKWFKQKAGDLSSISGERVQDELRKLLKKGESVSTALEFADEMGLLRWMVPGIKRLDATKINKLDSVPGQLRDIGFSIGFLLSDGNGSVDHAAKNLKLSASQTKLAEIMRWFVTDRPNAESIRLWMAGLVREVPRPDMETMRSLVGFLDFAGENTEQLKQAIKHSYMLQAPNSFAVTGKDLLVLGLRGVEIGKAQERMTRFLAKRPDMRDDVDTLVKIARTGKDDG